MKPGITVLERAYEMAASGRFEKLEHLVRSLKKEGYSVTQVEGPVLRTQLRRLIRANHKAGKSQELTISTR